MRSLVVFLILLIPFVSAWGQDDGLNITIVSPEHDSDSDDILHRFSTDTLSLEVSLKNLPSSSANLSFQFTQLGADLALPYESRFLARLLEANRPYSFHVTLPAVERISDFEFQLISETGNISSTVFKKRLRVYPITILDPLKAWALTHLLIVDDAEGSLSGLFQNRQIDFSPALERMGTGKTTVISILSGASSGNPDKLRKSLRGNGLIVVKRSNTLFPKLVSVERKGMRLVAIDESLLSHLQTNPRAQLALLEAFQLALPDVTSGLPFDVPLASIENNTE